MEEFLLNQLRLVVYGSLSHYLQGFSHPMWLFGISAINSWWIRWSVCSVCLGRNIPLMPRPFRRFQGIMVVTKPVKCQKIPGIGGGTLRFQWRYVDWIYPPKNHSGQWRLSFPKHGIILVLTWGVDQRYFFGRQMFHRNNFSKPGGCSSAYSSECRSDLLDL